MSALNLSATMMAADPAGLLTVADETVSVKEDNTLNGNVLAGTTSVSGPVTVTSFHLAGDSTTYITGHPVAIAGVGTLLINADGSYTFTPVANYNGSVPVATYTLTDGSHTDTSTLTITVTPVVDGFVDRSETANVFIDSGATHGSVLTGTTSVDGPVTLTSFSVAGNSTVFSAGQTSTLAGIGTLTVNHDGSYVFTPALHYTGPVPVITYNVTDGYSIVTSSLAINVVEHAPVAIHDSAIGSAGTPLTIAATTLMNNDSDPDGYALSLSSVQNATHGNVALVGSNVVFTPTEGYTGSASFDYTISDGHGGTSTTSVDLAFNSVNHAPTAVFDSATASADTPLTLTATTLISNDTDPDGDPLTLFSVQNANHGSIAMVGTNVVFTPTAGYTGAASFDYTISDGHGGMSTATVDLSVNPLNHAPLAVNDTASGTVNTSLTIAQTTLLSNDTDQNHDPLTISSVLDATHGTVALVDGNVVFTPTKDYVGDASFSYTVSDGHGGSSSASVSITIAADLLKAGAHH
jgi:hypothetical protein